MKASPSAFIMHLFTYDCSYESIIREQYELARRAHISLTESDNLTDFERQAFINMLIKDLKREAEHMKLPT